MPPRAMRALILKRSLITRPMSGSGAPVLFDMAADARSVIGRLAPVGDTRDQSTGARNLSVPAGFLGVNARRNRTTGALAGVSGGSWGTCRMACIGARGGGKGLTNPHIAARRT